MRKALRIAVAERPGPVHLTTAADVVGAAAVDDAVLLPPLAAGRAAQLFTREPGADPLRHVRAARRPVIVAGLAAVQADAGPALQRLAETLGCPVVLSPMAKGLLDEDHALFAGTLDMACNAFVWDFLRGADLLLAVGFDAVPNTDQILPAGMELVGDIAVLCEGLANALAGSEPRWREAEVAAHCAELRALCRGPRGRAAEPRRRGGRGARRAAARHDRQHRRGLAQAAGGPGLDHACAPHAAHQQRPVVDGLRPAGGDGRPAAAPRARGGQLHRRWRPGDGAGELRVAAS
jgi:hypothetical protein